MKSPAKALHRRLVRAGLAAVPFVLSSQLSAQSWDGGGANPSWGTAANWVGDPVFTFGTSVDLIFNNLTQPNNNVGAPRTVRSISYGADMDSAFATNFRTFDGGSAAILTLQAASGDASINVDSDAAGGITLGWGGVGTNAGSLALGSNLNVVHNGTGTLFVNRPITGAFNITKTGTGTLQLGSSANTASGSLNIDEGTVIAGAQSTTGADINAFSALNLRGGTLVVRTGFANKAIDTAPVTVSVASTLEMRGVPSGVTNYNVTFGGTAGFALNADLAYRNTSPMTGLTNGLSINRAITGTGNISVDTYNDIASNASVYGLGRLGLTGDNSAWSGDILINRGTVSLGGALLDGQASGTGAIVLGKTGDAAGAGLTFFSTAAGATTTTYGNDITVNTGGFRSIKGGNTDHGVTFTGDITLNSNLNVDHTLSSVRAITLAGDVTGAGGLDITRASGSATTSVILTGTNNYAGGTTIASTATLAIGVGGTTGSITGNIANAGALIFNRSDAFSFGGQISGAGTVAKAGAGYLTLGGTSGLSGGTTVSGGGLIVDGAFTNASNAVTVASGAALGGNGSIAGNVTFASGALFAFSPTATLNVAGTVTFDNTFGVASLVTPTGGSISWGSVNNGTYTLISNGGSFGNISNFGVANAFDLGDGRHVYFQDGSLELVVSAIPEPGTFSLIGGLMALGFVGSRRRSR